MEARSYLLQIYLPAIHLSIKHSNLNKFITHLLVKTVNIFTLEAEGKKKKKTKQGGLALLSLNVNNHEVTDYSK